MCSPIRAAIPGHGARPEAFTAIDFLALRRHPTRPNDVTDGDERVLAGAVRAYTETEEPGRPQGLIYRPFAEYAREKRGLQADVITELDPARMMAELDAGRLIIASVHPEIRRPQNDPPKTGGHLVLVTGHVNELATFHNPSGHIPEAAVATLPMTVFDRFAAHRGIALHL
jgi:hypothetical protein